MFGESQALIDLLRDAGIMGLMAVIIVGGMRRWYVWAWQYTTLEQERDWWRNVAMRTLRMGEAVAQKGEADESTMQRRLELLEEQLGVAQRFGDDDRR